MSATKMSAAIAAAALLVACGGEEQSELRQELAAMTKDLRGRVDPLPQVKSYEPVPYKGEGMLDPFVPGRIVVAQATAGGGGGGGVQPDLNRPKEPLEAYPLEALQMVGTLSQNKDMYALVKAGSNLFRVKKGNYMGQNFGVITGIEEGQISLKEVVQDSGGDWVERSSAVQMVEGNK
ncbi:MAG TPA: pilus assembly protein PilP [Burkholderiales bacterium]|nr:pilus assembly protein PilP [Burkholderiales bacterium]